MARKMKDSGVEWIGFIPDEWSIQRLRWCLKDINVKNDPIQTTQVLSLTNKQGVIPYEEKGNQGNKAKENVAEYKIACPNENCLYTFKINMQDWEEKVSDEEVHCPMCGHIDTSEKWWTQKSSWRVCRTSLLIMRWR